MTGTFNYEKDSDNIVTVTMDMSGPVNAMNDEYMALMGSTVERLEAERDSIAGVVLTSAKKTFFAGGDLNDLLVICLGCFESCLVWESSSRFVETVETKCRFCTGCRADLVCFGES